MSGPTFQLTAVEAAYVVGALCIVLDRMDNLIERDRIIMNAIIDRLAAPMDLSDEVKDRFEESRGRQ